MQRSMLYTATLIARFRNWSSDQPLHFQTIDNSIAGHIESMQSRVPTTLS